MLVCRRVLYDGRVQGVGFRFTTRNLAHHYPLAGYVRNLVNGQVELMVEGEGEVLDRFLTALAERMEGYIQNQTVMEETVQNFQGFEIRR